MKRTLVLSIGIAFFLVLFPSFSYAQEALYVQNQLIVKYRSSEAATRAPAAVSGWQSLLNRLFGRVAEPALDEQFGITEKTEIFASSTPQSSSIKLGTIDMRTFQNDSLANVYVLTLTQGTVAEAVEAYGENEDVEYAEPNYLAYATATPNDPMYPTMWALQKINMPQAWDSFQGGSEVIVAIADSGVNYNHPDIPRNIIKGLDAINNDMDPMDDHGHGTHVAGTIGAVTNNGVGVAGIAPPPVRLMAIKVLAGSGSGDFASISRGMAWAVENGAKVINMSLGGPQGSTTLHNAIKSAVAAGVTVVAASGNANTQTGYPAAYPEALSVGATDQSDNRASFSNYGKVEIAAPGVGIQSTLMSGGYGPLSGTSMASPHVAGVAGLLLSKNPSLSPAQVEQYLRDGADPISATNISGKRLNAYGSLTRLSGGTPGPTATIGPTRTPTPIGSTRTPTPSITPGGPTLSPTRAPTAGAATPVPTTSTEPLQIWIEQGGTRLEHGGKIQIGQQVQLCTNRAAGAFKLIIDRGDGGPLKTYLTRASCITGIMGTPASSEGIVHTYTAATNSEVKTTTIYVVSGGSTLNGTY